MNNGNRKKTYEVQWGRDNTKKLCGFTFSRCGAGGGWVEQMLINRNKQKIQSFDIKSCQYDDNCNNILNSVFECLDVLLFLRNLVIYSKYKVPHMKDMSVI